MMIKRKIAVFLCLLMCLSSLVFPTAAVGGRDITEHETCAVILKQLGLFKGVSETNFDLERAPTRIEALVMLIRVLGKEEEALNSTWEHPFNDVPLWEGDNANKYVGYAYTNGLTKGMDEAAGIFGSGESATAQMYLTFVLRALGYTDKDGADFTYADPFTLANEVGILHESIDVENFWRADVAAVSFLALSVNLKDSADTLADKLISAGAFTLEQYGAALNLDFSDATEPGTPTTPETDPAPETEPTPETEPIPETPPTPVTPPASGDKLNAEQISEKCAPAVFYIEVYGYSGKPIASGSGFFITENGYAITNRHVVLGNSYIEITTVDGKKYDNIKIVDVDEKKDLVLLKVNSGNRFAYLEVGNSDAVKQGQTIYAIGSPQGLENTLSQGIVSSPKRTIGEVTYIQMSAQIDNGSSGGALIDEYGKAVGVTAASIRNNNADLNLAIPINAAKGLNKNSTKKHTLWPDATYNDEYGLVDGMYDFGVFSGFLPMDLVMNPAGFEIRYDVTDAVPSAKNPDPIKTSLDNYSDAMAANGFTVTRAGMYAVEFKTDTVIITLSLDKETEEFILFTLDVKLQYYAKSPKVPDFGWYYDFGETKPVYTYKDEFHTYKYKVPTTSALFMYCRLLEDTGFKYSGESQMADGKIADSYIGYGIRVNCYADGEYVIIEISPASVTPQTAAIARLAQNLKAKGTYDAASGSYKSEKKISKVLYNVTLFEKTGIIHFSSIETVSAKSVPFADDMGVSDSDASVTLETYINLAPDGETTVTFICKSGNLVLRYEASFDKYSFSQNSSLTPKNNNVASKIQKQVHDRTVFQMVRTLNGCKSYLLNNLGVTLPELGFNNF